jgi:hypothetical protein
MTMALFSRTIRQSLKELRRTAGVDGPGLRNSLNALRAGFIGTPTTPYLRDTRIDRDKVRGLYYNKDSSIGNGSFMVGAIVDGTADFIGMPEVTHADPALAAQVNNWIQNYWKSSFWQLYRNTIRDSDCWVRLRLPFPNALVAVEEETICTLETIDSDRINAYYDPVTNQLNRVEIETLVWVEDEKFDPSMIGAAGARVYGREHRIIETITPDQFTYYDATTNQILEEYTTTNAWGFVPLIEFFNDFDSALHGGKSEVEQAYPFLVALHDLISQTRQIHAYHADPKVRFKLTDVMSFITNNWPESVVDGKFTGQVSWRDRDVFFMDAEDDASFIEATLSENSSVNLAEFLIDCICMAAEVTEGVLFRAHTEQQTTDTDQFFRFKRKIERKRINFQDYLQQIFKMATKISTNAAHRMEINWPPISVSDLAAEGQAMNQIITAAEVANRAGVISKATYGNRVRRFFPGMKEATAEQQDVKTEMDAEQQRTLDYEQRLAAIQAANSTAGQNGNSGINGAIKQYSRTRATIPLQVISPQPGE